MEDASQLFQNSAVVSEGAQKPSQAFYDVLNEMKSRWKQHKERQMAELEPWKVKETQKAKARHHGDRPKPTPPAKKVAPLTEEERRELEREARLAKYGEALTLIVREPGGREFMVKFRTGTRLQVLMHSICKKMGVELANTRFMFRDKALEPLSTPQEVGMADQDVIEMDGDALQEMAAKKQEEQKVAEEAAALKEKVQSKEQAEYNVKLEKKLRTAKRSADIQAEQKKKHELKARDMVTLRFMEAHGDGKEIHIAVKRDNWLQGTMQLVCKRMNYADCATKARFFIAKGGNRVLIKPHDSVRTLNLKDEELVMVRSSA